MNPAVILGSLATLILTPIVNAGSHSYRFDMPEPLWAFGMEWSADFAESPFDGVIAGARLHVTFNTSNAPVSFHDAADILFQFQPASVELPIWSVSGEDLGWTGAGQFTASISTDAFNGQSLITDGDLILWFGRIVSRDDGQPLLGGTLTDSYWEFDVQSIPAPATTPPVLLAFGLLARRRR